jgi:hypothetical protein
MKRLRRFLRLQSNERWLLIKAALLLEGIKLAMRLIPFKVLRRLADRAGRTFVRRRSRTNLPAQTVAWAVETVSQNTPGEKTCLTQALAAQVLLTRRGYSSLLHIGVVKDENGELLAHAWVECQNEIVVGGYELERYTLLTSLEGHSI